MDSESNAGKLPTREQDTNAHANSAHGPANAAHLAHSKIPRFLGWFFTTAIIGCVADLWTKAAAFARMGPPTGTPHIHWLIKDYVGIETALNFGAVFGLGQGKVWFFALMSLVALAGIFYWLFARNASHDKLLTITLGIITGGILGNLYDRLGLWSGFDTFAVRDWIRLSYGSYVWPNFNIADSLLVVGAGLLVWHSFRNPQQP